MLTISTHLVWSYANAHYLNTPDMITRKCSLSQHTWYDHKQILTISTHLVWSQGSCLMFNRLRKYAHVMCTFKMLCNNESDIERNAEKLILVKNTYQTKTSEFLYMHDCWYSGRNSKKLNSLYTYLIFTFSLVHFTIILFNWCNTGNTVNTLIWWSNQLLLSWVYLYMP